MADDPPNQQPPSSSNINNPDDHPINLEAKVEDAETRAAREELKHTVISDKQDSTTTARDEDGDNEMKLQSGTDNGYEALGSGKKTPDLTPPESLSRTDDASERKVSSPKKKRAHDEVDQQKEGDGATRTSSSTAESDGWVMVDGAEKDDKHRSEPQKKRARDETSPPADIHKATTPATTTTSDDSKADAGKEQPQTSATAFAASGFSKLATSNSSPFASVTATKSVFGGGAAASPSPFAALGASSPSKLSTATPNLPKPTLSFGNKDSSAPSPFATINGSTSSAFGGSTFGGSAFGGSAFGGGGFGSPFGSTLGGSKTGNFASPGIAPLTKSDKPAKPFGAPESDTEDKSEDGSDDEGDEAGNGDGEKDKDETASRDESTPAGGEDEKKAKYRKVAVDDGEAGEATVVQARARMYYLDKSTNADGKEEVGWRERGVGMLKVNVPVESLTADPESGAVDAKSFDPSILDGSTPENPKLVRLLMRQDSTLRLILNTAMLANMDFQIKEGFKSWTLLFTAIEGEEAKHVPVQVKMSPQSADNFLDTVEMIKKKMREAKS